MAAQREREDGDAIGQLCGTSKAKLAGCFRSTNRNGRCTERTKPRAV